MLRKWISGAAKQKVDTSLFASEWVKFKRMCSSMWGQIGVFSMKTGKNMPIA